MSVSISSLNLVKKCDTPFTLRVKNVDGTDSGLTIGVIGAHSSIVKDFVASKMNEQRLNQAMEAKMNPSAVTYQKAEDDAMFSVQNVATRISWWEGITEECTFENACLLCTVNPDIRRQVFEASENLANFTTA